MQIKRFNPNVYAVLGLAYISFNGKKEQLLE